MINGFSNSISINATFDHEVTPDCALIKLHFTGEGITLEDAVANVQRKVAEATEALRSIHTSIYSIQIFDIYFGQKEDRVRSEAQAYPRPLVVQGVLVRTSPTDPSSHYRIVDDGIKRGALLENPHRPSYFSDTLDSAILYGLIDSETHESLAIEGCLKVAAKRARTIAIGIGKKLGDLISTTNAGIDPSMGDPLRKDYAYICRCLPTKFLSPTHQKVVLTARLTATYSFAD